MSKLVECKSCKHTVDSSAKTCPSCGVSKPGAKRSVRLWALFGVFLVIAIQVIDKGAKQKTADAVKDDQPKSVVAVKSESIKPENNKIETISVSDFKYTMNDKQAISILFGETQSNFCSVTIYRAAVKQGYSVSSAQRDDHSISVDCNWNGRYFLESSKHPTFSSVSIVSLDKDKKSAQIEISVKLIELKGLESYFSLDNVKLNISADKFDNLIKKL